MYRSHELSEHEPVSESGQVRQRRLYAVEEKLRMVEQTREPGASVARVAQAHGVNPNVLFLWRRQHREGRLIPLHADAARLLPVAVLESGVRDESAATEPARSGSVEVELPRGRVRIEGHVDAATLRVVLGILSR
jgi:transposase